MRVLVTGSKGFMGKNLVVRLSEQKNKVVSTFSRGESPITLKKLIRQVDAIVHLAGENRPKDERAFTESNVDLTRVICEAIQETGRHIPLIFVSSIQATNTTPYGKSKREAELILEQFATVTSNPVIIYRLPNTFGKWAKPNYNSVVATFCYNTAHDLPIQIHDPHAPLRLVYIDDVISTFLSDLNRKLEGLHWGEVRPVYTLALGELAAQIDAFKWYRLNLNVGRVGVGLTRALYATYVSYLPLEKFAYDLTRHADDRGVFVEMLKTPDCGQFSFFTAHPGVTRGGHYHHSKTEKFLVVKGVARFNFRHIITNQFYELLVNGDKPQVVETIPGWVHDITNIGQEEMIVMIWANEVFDKDRPDTMMCHLRSANAKVKDNKLKHCKK